MWQTAWAILLVLLLPNISIAQQPPDNIAAAYLVSLNGKTIWAAHEHDKLPPASLTKLMTALLVATLKRGDEWVTISKLAAKQKPTRIGVKAGEQLQVRDLSAAMLIHSANDACLALAEWAAGSEAEFVKLMNAEAAALGLGETHFNNACGFDAPEHFSSASDLALLSNEVMQQPSIMQLVALRDYKISTRKGRRIKFATHNALLGRLKGAVGLKTGYTNHAGPCVIALAERIDAGKKNVALAVMLNAKNRWWITDELVERAFAFH